MLPGPFKSSLGLMWLPPACAPCRTWPPDASEDPYTRLLALVLLPKLANALTNAWEPRDPEPPLRFLEAWAGALPPSVQRHVLDTLILPKVRSPGPTASLLMVPNLGQDHGTSTGVWSFLSRAGVNLSPDKLLACAVAVNSTPCAAAWPTHAFACLSTQGGHNNEIDLEGASLSSESLPVVESL